MICRRCKRWKNGSLKHRILFRKMGVVDWYWLHHFVHLDIGKKSCIYIYSYIVHTDKTVGILVQNFTCSFCIRIAESRQSVGSLPTWRLAPQVNSTWCGFSRNGLVSLWCQHVKETTPQKINMEHNHGGLVQISFVSF